MKVLVCGATGMLGRAILWEAKNRGVTAYGVSRGNADLVLDLTRDREVESSLRSLSPDIIINCAAITNLRECERNPSAAYRVNSRLAAILAESARTIGAYYVHISTDHFFTGDGNAQHAEEYPVRLVNEYARTKYAGESFALTAPKALVVRTNILGYRGIQNLPTFMEWLITALKNEEPITLFEDYFTSGIDVGAFSRALFDLMEKMPVGTINVACREVYSKKVFIEALASRLEYPLRIAAIGKVADFLEVPRAESAGLDVGKAESILEYFLPTLVDVIEALVSGTRRENG